MSDLLSSTPPTDDVQQYPKKRATPRRPMRLAVRFRSCDALAEAVRATTRNVGLGGLCLKTEKVYERGTPLELFIEFGESLSLKVQAKVAWVAPGRAIGVQFEALEAETAQKLNALLG